MTRAEELAAIAEHIAVKGVTRCITAHASFIGFLTEYDYRGVPQQFARQRGLRTLDTVETSQRSVKRHVNDPGTGHILWDAPPT